MPKQKQKGKIKDKIQDPKTVVEQATPSTKTYSDEMLVYKFDFSNGSSNDVPLFTCSLDERRSSTLTASELEKSFPIMIANFKTMITNLNMNQKWEIVRGRQPILEEEGYKAIKLKFKIMLSPLIVKSNYNNIIFEFNRHKPFTNDMRLTYKFIINAFVDQTLKDITTKQAAIDTTKYVLSLFLGHAITCNNPDAINILITEYHVSLIKTFSMEGKSICMPILRTIDLDEQEACSISLIEHGEDEFISLLEHIDFSQPEITSAQIQKIFVEVYTAEFRRAFDKLIKNKSFMKKFVLADDTVMMLAIANVLSIPSLMDMSSKLQQTMSISSFPSLLQFIKMWKGMLNDDPETTDMLACQTSLEYIQFLVNRHKKYKQIIFERNQKIQEITTELTKQTIQTKLSEEKITGSLSKELILQEANENLEKQLEELTKEQHELTISKNNQLASRDEETDQLKKENQELEARLEISSRNQKTAESAANLHKFELSKAQQILADAHASSPRLANPIALTQSERTIWQLKEYNRSLTYKNAELKAISERKIQIGKLRAQQIDVHIKERDAHIKEQHEKWQQLHMSSSELRRIIITLQELNSRTTLPNTAEAQKEEIKKFEEYLNYFKNLNGIDIDVTENLDNFFDFLHKEFTRLLALENAVKTRPRSFSG